MILAEKWTEGMFGKEEMDRILIHNSPIQKTRVWFIGDTGHGKTTTVGKLTARDDIQGKDGFSHDTKQIREYELSYIHKPTASPADDTTRSLLKKTSTSTSIIYSNVLVDTRGTSDIGVDVHYSAKDLFIDMNAYYTYAEESKVVFVIMNRRLQPGQLKMIRDLYNAFQSKFLILITGTMDNDGRSRKELLKLFKANDITFTGTILAVDWFFHGAGAANNPQQEERAPEEQMNPVSARRYKILDAIENLQSINVRALSPHGIVVRSLNDVENKCQEVLKVPYAVDGLLICCVAATSLLLLIGASTSRSSSAR